MTHIWLTMPGVSGVCHSIDKCIMVNYEQYVAKSCHSCICTYENVHIYISQLATSNKRWIIFKLLTLFKTTVKMFLSFSWQQLQKVRTAIGPNYSAKTVTENATAHAAIFININACTVLYCWIPFIKTCFCNLIIQNLSQIYEYKVNEYELIPSI